MMLSKVAQCDLINRPTSGHTEREGSISWFSSKATTGVQKPH